MIIRIALVGALALTGFSCGKKEAAEQTASTGEPSAGPGQEPAAAPEPTPEPPEAPPAPAPTPVDLGPDDLHPSCEKLLPAELAEKVFGADEVTSDSPRLAICTAKKAGEVVGTLTVACRPGLDTTTFGGERAAMSKARDLEPMVGRAGYRLGQGAFFVLDDETPCRLQIMFTNPSEESWPDAIRAIVAQVSPENLK